MLSTTKKALVLSGGSIKGAFEAGALKAVFEKGYKPDYIYGISVGCLNSTFIANEAALQWVNTRNVDWIKVGEALWNFWNDEITSPGKLVKKKSNLFLLLSLNWGLIFKNFKSILDTTPLQNLIKKRIDPDIIKNAPVKLEIGTVNIYNGEINYVSPGIRNFLDYVVASTAIPITMPVKLINNLPFLDGGLRDVAPFGRAINNGADEIIGVCCQSKDLTEYTYNYKDLVVLLDRLLAIIVNETINNDIKLVDKFNKIISEISVPEGSTLSNYKYIEHKVIRPDKEIMLDIKDFTHQDIVSLLEQGYNEAKKQLQGKSW